MASAGVFASRKATSSARNASSSGLHASFMATLHRAPNLTFTSAKLPRAFRLALVLAAISSSSAYRMGKGGLVLVRFAAACWR